MLAALADPILPIFLVMVAGFVLRRLGVFDEGQAAGVNRFVFYIGTPALVFTIIATADLAGMRWPILVRYLAAEIAVYAAVALIARHLFHRDWPEALLIGMAAAFSNHVFFVLPISTILYGVEVTTPIAGIVLVDVLVFCATVLIVDILTSGSTRPARALSGLVRNPFVYAPPLALLAWWAGDTVPSGIFTYAGFAGAAAAPASLFALGVILAGAPLAQIGGLVWVAVGAKLLVHPALVWLALANHAEATDFWSHLPVLVAAGPCGAMPFVIAVQYGVRSQTIAKAVFVSTVLSLFTLALLV